MLQYQYATTNNNNNDTQTQYTPAVAFGAPPRALNSCAARACNRQLETKHTHTHNITRNYLETTRLPLLCPGREIRIQNFLVTSLNKSIRRQMTTVIASSADASGAAANSPNNATAAAAIINCTGGLTAATSPAAGTGGGQQASGRGTSSAFGRSILRRYSSISGATTCASARSADYELERDDTFAETAGSSAAATRLLLSPAKRL